MSSELVAITANIALVLSFVVALVFGIAQVRAAAQDRRERFALEVLRNFQTREFAELIHYVTECEVPASRVQLRALSAGEQVMFIQLSQQMEALGLLVSSGQIDLDLVDKTLGSFVITSWEKYAAVFRGMREETDDPFLGEYFQWLAEKITASMRDNPREPFYKM